MARRPVPTTTRRASRRLRFSRGNRDIAVDEVRASDTDQVKVMALDQLMPVVVNRGEAECRHCVHPPVIPSVVGDSHQDRLEG